MLNSRMLYKYPGPHPLQDGGYDYVIVLEDDAQAKLSEGWHLTPQEARFAHENPTKVDPVEQSAKEVEETSKEDAKPHSKKK